MVGLILFLKRVDEALGVAAVERAPALVFPVPDEAKDRT